MTALRRWLRRLLAFFRSTSAEAELTREIAAHLQLLEDGYRAQGMNAVDARAAARRAFGGVDQTRARQRDARSFRWLDESWLDFKLGARMLIKYPGLSLVGGVAMAVAIAFGAGTFTFFYSHLYATLPLHEGDRIIALENWNLAVNNEHRQALHDYLTWRAEMKSVQEIGAFRTVGRNLIVPGGTAEPIRIAEITASGFGVARVPPLIGRPLLEDDHRDGAPPVVVIGHDVWQARFAADPAVVGRDVRIGNNIHTIVGVMPAGFAFPMSHSYWVPLRADASSYERGQGPAIFIFGRLAPGATIEQAQAELTTIGQRTAAAFPTTHQHLQPRVLPYTYPLLDIQDVSLWQVSVMQLTISLLLIIVALNVAILVYARTATRQGEIAVRTSLGASRGRIIGQLFIEALVLSALSAGVGLLLARVGLHLANEIMRLEGLGMPFWMNLGLSLPAVLYVVALALLAALIAGVVPAIQATGRHVQSTLRQLGGGTGLRLGGTWTVLIVAQVSLAVAALPAVVALGWSEVRPAMATPEFAAEEYLAAGIAIDSEPPSDVDPTIYWRDAPARFATLQARLIERLEGESWVADLTRTTALPGNETSARIEVEGVAPPTGAAGHAVDVNDVDIDYFDAFDVAILTGRGFDASDRESALRADNAVDPVIVNRTFVQRILRGGNALGQRLRYVTSDDADPDGADVRRWAQIVGVVEDLNSNFIEPDMTKAEMYHPLRGPASSVNLVLRVRGGEPAGFSGRVREIATEIDPTLRIRAFPLLDIYRQQNVALRLVGLILGLIMLSVLLLSAAGIYALMSFTVAERRKEIGIRAALGADPRQLLLSIFARAAGQLAIGVVTGFALITLLDRLSDGELLQGLDRLVLPAVVALMLVAGLLAALGPARRGLRIQPTQALREP